LRTAGVLRGEVVHHQHGVGPHLVQLGQQHLVQVSREHQGVGCGLDRHGGDDAVCGHRAQHGQPLPPACGHAPTGTLAARRTAM